MAAKKKKKFSIRKLVYNDKYLIALSILAAIVIWVVTSISYSPETTKKIVVPVAVDFSDTLAEQLGIEYYDSTDITVEVTVSCKKYLAKDIDEGDITAYLQTGTVTSTGYHSVPILVTPNEGQDFTIVSYYPTSAEGYYDIYDEQSFPIDISFSNTNFTADGYVTGQTTLSEETVTVEGPKGYVSRVKNVSASVSLDNNLTESQLVELELVALDENGNKVDYVKIREQVTANIPVLKVQNLEPSVNFINAPANAKDLVEIKYSVKSIEAGVLETAADGSLVLGEIDFSQVKVGDNEFTFNIDEIGGVTALDGTKEVEVTVTVPSDFETKTLVISRSNISASAPSGYSAKVTSLQRAQITVIASKDEIDSITADNLVMTCDINNADGSEIKTGTSAYPIIFTLKNTKTAWVYGTYNANVEVTKAE